MKGKFHKKKFAKKPYNSRWTNYKNALGQLGRDVGILKSLINVEYKNFETNGSGTLSNTPAVYLLNDVQRGTDYNQVDGRSCRFKSIQLFMNFVNTTSTVPCPIRWALVLNKDADQGFSYNDVWTDISSGFRNLNYRKDNRILETGTFMVDQYHAEKQIKKYKKVNFHTVWNGTQSGTIADMQANALYLLVWSGAGANFPTYGFRCRLRYIDN